MIAVACGTEQNFLKPHIYFVLCKDNSSISWCQRIMSAMIATGEKVAIKYFESRIVRVSFAGVVMNRNEPKKFEVNLHQKLKFQTQYLFKN